MGVGCITPRPESEAFLKPEAPPRHPPDPSGIDDDDASENLSHHEDLHREL